MTIQNPTSSCRRLPQQSPPPGYRPSRIAAHSGAGTPSQAPGNTLRAVERSGRISELSYGDDAASRRGVRWFASGVSALECRATVRQVGDAPNGVARRRIRLLVPRGMANYSAVTQTVRTCEGHWPKAVGGIVSHPSNEAHFRSDWIYPKPCLCACLCFPQGRIEDLGGFPNNP